MSEHTQRWYQNGQPGVVNGHLEVGNRQLARRVARGLVQGTLQRRRELRYQVVRELWAIAKRFAAGDQVPNVPLSDVPALRDAVVEGYIDDRNRAVLAALCRATRAETFFEIGTNRGRTAWTVARTNPALRVYTLDLPSPEASVTARYALLEAELGLMDGWQRGVAYRDTPEADRIDDLLGDSATFDFAPYEGKMDIVFIDGSHAYPYVRNDTLAALRMLSPRGAIVWDDYPGFPGVLRAVLEAAEQLEGPITHVLGTRLAIWSRQPLEIERAPDVAAVA